MGAAALVLHESHSAHARRRATVTGKPIVVTQERHVARASTITADAVAACGAGAVARRIGVDHSLVSRWTDPSSERLPNVGHLLAEGGAFARGVLTGALAALDGERPLTRADLEREAVVLMARMGAVLVAANTIRPEMAPAAARAIKRDIDALVGQAERLARALAALSREAP